MTVKAVVDFTMDGSPQAIGSAGQKATWITFRLPGSIRIGDANVALSPGRGLLGSNSPAQAVIEFPRIPFGQGQYDLSSIYLIGNSGTGTVTYGD